MTLFERCPRSSSGFADRSATPLFQQRPLTILALRILSARSAFAGASRGRTISAIATGVVVVVATALSHFRGINVGAIWARTQYEFYRSLEARLSSGDISSLVVPCGHGRPWQWISPGIPAEYGYTSIGWERYIQNQLERRSSPVSFEITCAEQRTEFEEGAPYVRQEGRDTESWTILDAAFWRFLAPFIGTAMGLCPSSTTTGWRRQPYLGASLPRGRAEVKPDRKVSRSRLV